MPTPQELASSLSPEDFELMLRAYLQQRFDGLRKARTIYLHASLGYGKSRQIETCQWSVGEYLSATKGEILDRCVPEQNRRDGFEESCTLRLIEASVEPVASNAGDDSIPF